MLRCYVSPMHAVRSGTGTALRTEWELARVLSSDNQLIRSIDRYGRCFLRAHSNCHTAESFPIVFFGIFSLLRSPVILLIRPRKRTDFQWVWENPHIACVRDGWGKAQDTCSVRSLSKQNVVQRINQRRFCSRRNKKAVDFHVDRECAFYEYNKFFQKLQIFTNFQNQLIKFVKIIKVVNLTMIWISLIV